MGWWCPPVYGKHTGREERKIARIDRKIASLQEDRKIYEEKIAERKDKEVDKKTEVIG